MKNLDCRLLQILLGALRVKPALGVATLQSTFLFVCVEVLRPSQPDGVMPSAVSLHNHTFTGQA